ncbi:MAG: Unknown protein [uncultured Sulfurovum sp.]|uniref:Uncharacterized protein n=1 Tax=uncultured Sulfurovum sp. TaxID=269237 RepID=A0A6S6TCZ8_9BACT|nr:MAG: Unknown protein [uncultured Sulfurovum sp.]
MKKIDKKELILWIKRILGFMAMGLWLFVIYEISQMSVSFMEQAPYCMGSTMLIFLSLTFTYKGLDYWNKKKNF